ncbi:MAG: hypothetical protein ACI9BF_000550 [Candidatus Paceibacteria bacterium]|jgi:hypothetical protein
MKIQKCDPNGTRREEIDGKIVCYRDGGKNLWDSRTLRLADIRPDDGSPIVTAYIEVEKEDNLS